MAITISTVPTDYSSRAVFVASTGITEDSTHVNVRIEAQLMSGSPILAKKTNPKALTTFDFTDILRSFIGFTNPTPFTNPAAADIVAPTKSGSNLITSWANKTSFLWTNFTSSGANISVCNGTPGATNMMCESNAISFVDGTVYVLLWKSKALTGSFPYLEIGSTGATPLGTYSNYNNTELEDSAANRLYFLCKSTGSYKLTIGAKAGDGAVSLAGNFELYAMSTHDWYKQYSVKFVEKWEDANGATQTGATGDNFKLYTFFKSSADQSTFNSTYIEAVGGSQTAKFLNVDGYFQNTQRSIEIIKTPLTGNKSTANLISIIAPHIYNLDIEGVTFTAEDIFSPIICVAIPSTDLTASTIIALIDPVTSDGTAGVTVCLNSKCYPYHKELQWINELGGISQFFLGDEFKQKYLNQKDTYQDANKIKRLYNATPITEITVGSHFLTRQETAQYLADIITSELVMENTTVYKQVFVQDEEMPVRDKGNLMTVEVTYQYGS